MTFIKTTAQFSEKEKEVEVYALAGGRLAYTPIFSYDIARWGYTPKLVNPPKYDMEFIPWTAEGGGWVLTPEGQAAALADGVI